MRKIDDDQTRRVYERTLRELAAADRARSALASMLARRRNAGQVYMGSEHLPTPGEIRLADMFVSDLIDAGWVPPGGECTAELPCAKCKSHLRDLGYGEFDDFEEIQAAMHGTSDRGA